MIYRRTTILCLAFLLTQACTTSSEAPPRDVPFDRTEERQDCVSYDVNRQPFFGEQHVHTSFSYDTIIMEQKINGPAEAYAFAKGESVFLPESFENIEPVREIQLERPLDWAIVTDHSEWLGATFICNHDDSATGVDSEDCTLQRKDSNPDNATARVIATSDAFNAWRPPVNGTARADTDAGPDGGFPEPMATEMPMCFMPGVDCTDAKISAWQETQAAAEQAYDRSSACTFTSFVAWEYSSAWYGQNLHRNVIFRNDDVMDEPISAVDTNHDETLLWDGLTSECLDLSADADSESRCDVLTIPHNSNASNGLMWQDPASAEEAALRNALEPLFEVYQHKGASECRFDYRFGTGVGTTDEMCGFEQSSIRLLGSFAGPLPPPDEFPERSFARNALKRGLELEEELGVNPFQFGFVASTDTHNASPGYTEEDLYDGHIGANDSDSPRGQLGINQTALPFGTNGSGGLAVLWAEENSRDSLFAAMRRREAYGTSGTRPLVRMFVGDLPDNFCDRSDAIEIGYAQGVPMGGEIGDVRSGESPKFALMASKDPGVGERVGTDLQRVQIIKGWVDGEGNAQEKVYDVVTGGEGASVDTNTCERQGEGLKEVCEVWEDPDFDAAERAFYYMRVLENPTCRWHIQKCREYGVEPFADQETCLQQADENLPPAAGIGVKAPHVCCLNLDTDPPVEQIVQERAWGSPVWYGPDYPVPAPPEEETP